MSKQPKHSHTIGWDDDNIRGSNFTERPEIYKGKQGYTDIVRIVTHPISHYVCSVNPKGRDAKGFTAVSLADHDDITEGIVDGNDREARKRAEAACPMIERGYQVKRRFVAGIWHAFRIAPNGKRKRVGQFMPMIFDGGKYAHIRTIAKSLPAMRSGKQRPLHSVELQITCTDSQFQKMNFSLNPTPSEKWEEVKEKLAEHFDDGWDITGNGCDLITALLEPDDRQRLIQSIERVEGKAGFESEDDSDEWAEDGEDFDEDDDDEKPRRRKPAGKKTSKKASKKASKKTGKKKPAPADDEDSDDEDADIAEELDDALDDSDIDDYEEDED